MKLTNRQIVDSIEAIQKLNKLKLPVRASFRIAKTSRNLDEVLTDYNKTINKLRDEYSEKDSNGEMKVNDNKIVFRDLDGFIKASNELLDIENDVDVQQIGLDDFGEMTVEPSLLYSIDWLIDDS